MLELIIDVMKKRIIHYNKKLSLRYNKNFNKFIIRIIDGVMGKYAFNQAKLKKAISILPINKDKNLSGYTWKI